MISSHSSITQMLRDGASLTLHVAEERAHIDSARVAWKTARAYVRRLRNGNQPQLARRVVLEYPDWTITVKEESERASGFDPLA